MGLPTLAIRSLSVYTLDDVWVHGYWVQDTWKVTDKLTVNAGLRWDINFQGFLSSNGSTEATGDMDFVSGLAEQAQRLLDAALSAKQHGNSPTAMTILVTHDGAIRMYAESDWPLESLAREHGARTAFRITGAGGCVRVQAQQGPHRCVLESRSTAAIARLLLGA